MTGEVSIEMGWDQTNRHIVYDWNADRSSGWIVATFSERLDAVRAARHYAAKNGRHLHTAEIVSLRPQKEVLF